MLFLHSTAQGIGGEVTIVIRDKYVDAIKWGFWYS